MRKLWMLGAALLLFAGAIFVWRAAHPPLSDAQQIAAALDDIAARAKRRDIAGISGYLSRDFKFGDTGRKEFQNSLVGGVLGYRGVDLVLSQTQTELRGDTAQTTGRYELQLRSELNSPPETYRGRFVLNWRRQDGQWLIARAQGDQLPG